jgi:ribonuclease P protein component
VGNAVARNRLRRRLRALMDELRPGLPDGLYLIKCDFRAGTLSFAELRTALAAAIEDARLARVP